MHSAVLKYPYPYKGWLALANDPDNTVIEDWKELHSFIWEELELPFGDSLFVRSFNQNLPDQVSLETNPEIGSAHHHDIIHTWGDYMHARRRGFDREDAIEAAQTLKKAGIQPRVWIDHASFVGNMIHGTDKGAKDKLVDSSGHVYENFVYSLDVAKDLGIRYIWNGEVTDIVGQDRKLGFSDHKVQSGGSSLKASAKSVLQQVPGIRTGYVAPDNRQYFKKKFPDGSELYCFRRYGTWKDADIDGLHNLINPKKIDQLLQKGGTAIVYSHIGKRHPDGFGRKSHIPDSTRADLRNLKQKFDSKELMLSSISAMLDYLVIRDNLEVDSKNSIINFKPDGIRYENLSEDDLKGMHFSFLTKQLGTDSPKVVLDGKAVSVETEQHEGQITSIHF
jgi:hypothetical protein